MHSLISGLWYQYCPKVQYFKNLGPENITLEADTWLGLPKASYIFYLYFTAMFAISKEKEVYF